MDTLAIITIIGGIALLVALFGGGIKAKEIEIPSIPRSVRFLSGLTGIVLIGMAVWLSLPHPGAAPAPAAAISPASVQPSEPTAEPIAQATDPAAAPTAPPTAQAAAPPAPTMVQATAPTTPTIAQAPTGELLFFEDFEDGKADDFKIYEEDWRVTEDGTGNSVLEAKSLGNPPTGWTEADFGPVTLGDYSVEYRVRLVEYDFSINYYSGWTGLKFRQSSPGSYLLVLNPYLHQIELDYFWPNGSFEPLIADEGVHAFDFQKNIWYAIRIEAYGSRMNVIVDGNLLFSLEEFQVDRGRLCTPKGSRYDCAVR